MGKKRKKEKIKTVNILGLTYQIKLVEKVLIDNIEQSAKIDCEQQIIEINKNLAKERMQQVLLHEIIHCILWEVERSMFHKENFVQRLASSIFMLYKDNKDLLLF